MEPVLTKNVPVAGVDPLKRTKVIYAFVIIEFTLMVLLVFAEPTLKRLAAGEWSRGRFLFFPTLSLDVHGLVSFSYLFLMLGQMMLGFLHGRSTTLRRWHQRLGRFLYFGLIPVFFLAGIWVSADRALNIPTERAVVFKVDPGASLGGLVVLVLVCLAALIRSYRAIKKRDVRTHMDAIFATFAMASAVAIIRFVYLLFWLTRGGSPFSIMGSYAITMVVIFTHMLLAYHLAGRLKENARAVGMYLLVFIVYFVAAMPYYTIWDVG